jgi:hypothetical protein
MQKRNKTKKAIKVQDLKPKKDAKGGTQRYPHTPHTPNTPNRGPLNPNKGPNVAG